MADLLAPIVPVPDTSALQYVAKGLSGMMANRRYQQQYELAAQKMVQDAALEQQKFGLAREQVANQYEVQQAQIDNLHAEANLRNTNAKFIETTKTEDVKARLQAHTLLGPFKQALDSIPLEQQGTNEGANALTDITTDEKWAPVFDLPGGRQLIDRAEARQKRAENRRAQDNVILNNRFNQTLTQKGIDPTQMDFLEQNDKGGFVKNNVWNVNPDGSPYLTIQPATTTTPARIVPPSEYEGKITPTEKGWISSTLDKDEAKRLLQMKAKINDFSVGKSAPPIDVLQDAHAANAGEQKAAEIKRLFQAGQIDQSTALQQLQALGYQ